MPGHAKTLNPRRIAFTQYRVGPDGSPGMSPTAAYIKAGYKPSPYAHIRAAQLDKQPLVAHEIERLRNLARATLQLDLAYWQRELIYQYTRTRDGEERGSKNSAQHETEESLNEGSLAELLACAERAYRRRLHGRGRHGCGQILEQRRQRRPPDPSGDERSLRR